MFFLSYFIYIFSFFFFYSRHFCNKSVLFYLFNAAVEHQYIRSDYFFVSLTLIYDLFLLSLSFKHTHTHTTIGFPWGHYTIGTCMFHSAKWSLRNQKCVIRCMALEAVCPVELIFHQSNAEIRTPFHLEKAHSSKHIELNISCVKPALWLMYWIHFGPNIKWLHRNASL